MAYSSADLVAIQTAIARGERKVKFADREAEFRDLAELEQIEKKIQAELNKGTSSAHSYPRHQQASFSD